MTAPVTELTHARTQSLRQGLSGSAAEVQTAAFVAGGLHGCQALKAGAHRLQAHRPL
ncbi:hypothetical protein DENIT_10760 [Pseudomonas veronii]|nr:hypothetical protein DENIT_10760 [Pseudomonas veronii]